MPELPEVETIARNLRPILSGQCIRAVQVLWPGTIAEPSVQSFEQRLPGQTILEVGRRGKYLMLRLSRDLLLIHLRMSGDLQWRQHGASPQKHDRVLFIPDAAEVILAFHDPRKFGRVWLVQDPEKVLGGLGPEPLDAQFTSQALEERLRGRDRRLKPLLLDQTFLAGLGNIYADEALHRAGLHPLRVASELTGEEVSRLWQAIRQVLLEGIQRNGASIDWVYRGGQFQNYFQVYGRAGQPCYRCGQPIERIRLAQRSSYFCRGCQR
uniref:Formamidopyrimidine-DNA glycosylase n=1 Tax=uncultured Chloroflexota bacterium TaxID=166587 RepID=H5S8Q4_9CHLR|nr:formamidopyrimidine-DNA glycosylase [uncultured Chloroflexota bacterium]